MNDQWVCIGDGLYEEWPSRRTLFRRRIVKSRASAVMGCGLLQNEGQYQATLTLSVADKEPNGFVMLDTTTDAEGRICDSPEAALADVLVEARANRFPPEMSQKAVDACNEDLRRVDDDAVADAG